MTGDKTLPTAISEAAIKEKLGRGYYQVEIMALIAHPDLTREAAEPIFRQFNERPDIYWAMDVREGLLKKFAQNAQDPWWIESWEKAKDEYDLISGWVGRRDEAIRADRKEQWLQLINLLLEFPGIPTERFQWMLAEKSSDLRDIYGAVLAYPGIGQEFTEALLNSLSRGERSMALDNFLSIGLERGVFLDDYILTEALGSLGTGWAELALGSQVIDLLDDARLLKCLAKLSHASPQFLAAWLADKGRQRLAGLPKEIINELMRSPHKEVRVAVVKFLGRADRVV